MAKTDEKKPSGIAAVKAAIVEYEAKTTERQQKAAARLMDTGKTHTFRLSDVGTIPPSAQVRKALIDNEKGTVRLLFAPRFVAAQFCAHYGITADEFRTLRAEYQDTARYPVFAAVVLETTPKTALLAAVVASQKVSA